jgi:hypothetical protein
VACQWTVSSSSNWLYSTTYYDMVSRHLSWHDQDKRAHHGDGRTATLPGKWVRGADSIQSPSDLFILAVISHQNRARISVDSLNHRAEITGGQVPCTRDLLQSTVPWRVHSVRLIEQLEGPFSSISMW